MMNTCTDQPRNVVPLWRRRDQQMGSVVRTVLAHWSSLPRDGTVPNRSRLDLRVLATALPNAFLLERPRPDVVRFRLAGQHLHHTMGMDVRGMPLRAFFEISDRRRLMEKVNQVFREPAMLDLELVSDAQGRAVLEGRMCLLPLNGPDGEITRALGVLATDGLIGLPPRRFRIRHMSCTRIAEETRYLAQMSTGSEGSRPVHDAHPHLRIIRGGLI